MNFIGIDLHKNSSQVCILTDDGELIERRIKTDRESFDKLLVERPPARICEYHRHHFNAKLRHERR
jgi:predicted NBD/HSP70 family sugar kinase